MDFLVVAKRDYNPILYPLFGQAALVSILIIGACLKKLNFFGYAFILVGFSSFIIFICLKYVDIKSFFGKFSALENRTDKLFLPFRNSLIFIFTIYLIVAAAPDLGYDSLQNKAWLPRQWYHSQDVFLNTDHMLNGVISSQSFVVYLGNLMGNSNIGSNLQVIYLLFTLIAILHFNQQKLQDRLKVNMYALIIVVFTTPAFLFQASAAYDDVWLLLLVSSTFIFILKKWNNNSLETSIFIGVATGALLLAKFSLAPYAFGFALPFLIKVLLSNQSIIRRFTNGLVLILTFVLVSCSFYVYKWVNYGNPLWPLYNAVFRSETLPATNEKFNFPIAKNLSLTQYLLAPIDTYFFPGNWGEEIAPGVYGISLALILCAFILSIFLIRKLGCMPVFLFTTVLINWWINFRYLRYIIPMLGIMLSCWILYESERVPRYTKRSNLKSNVGESSIVLLLIGALCVISLPIGNPTSPDRIPYKVALGLESQSHYLNRATPVWSAAESINLQAPQDSVVVTSVMPQALWLRVDIELYYYWETVNKPDIQPNLAVVSIAQPLETQIGPFSKKVCGELFSNSFIKVLKICR